MDLSTRIGWGIGGTIALVLCILLLKGIAFILNPPPPAPPEPSDPDDHEPE